MRAHGRHTGTTTNKHHLVISVFGKEFTEGPVDRNLIPWFEAKDIG